MSIASLPSLNVQMPQADAAKEAAMLKATKDKKAAHEASVKFEALFMNEMLSHMFEGIDTDGPFSGGHGEKVFQSMMVEQYGHVVAESGQTGLSASIEKAILRMQEEQSNPRLKQGA